MKQAAESEDGIKCGRCKKTLVAADGRLVAEGRSTSGGVECFPRCSAVDYRFVSMQARWFGVFCDGDRVGEVRSGIDGWQVMSYYWPDKSQMFRTKTKKLGADLVCAIYARFK